MTGNKYQVDILLILIENFMDHNTVDNAIFPEIMTPEETAQFLKKSVSWVYKHWKNLGGVKLGGSLFFPNKEDLYEFIFCKREGVEVRLHPRRKTVHKNMVQNQKKGQAGRGQKKGGNTKPGNSDDHGSNPNRHGILGLGE